MALIQKLYFKMLTKEQAEDGKTLVPREADTQTHAGYPSSWPNSQKEELC